MGNYKHKPDHRNGSPQKSQWDKNKVTILGEENIWSSFIPEAIRNNNCSMEQISYGLLLNNNKPDYLGFPARNSNSALNRLFISKFRSSYAANTETWHGYPADTTQNVQDRPDEQYLREWIKNNYISPAKASKILKGKKCDL